LNLIPGRGTNPWPDTPEHRSIGGSGGHVRCLRRAHRSFKPVTKIGAFALQRGSRLIHPRLIRRPKPTGLAAMNSTSTTLAVVSVGLFCGIAAPSRAESPAPASLTVISPVFGQLVRFSMPANFAAVTESTKDTFYIREAVLKGETVKQWS
jgi:hypothetical protein